MDDPSLESEDIRSDREEVKPLLYDLMLASGNIMLKRWLGSWWFIKVLLWFRMVLLAKGSQFFMEHLVESMVGIVDPLLAVDWLC